MKILSVGEFDAASVSLGHRTALKAVGIDYRVAIQRALTVRQFEADWVAEEFTRWETTPQGNRGVVERVDHDVSTLRAFAEEADVIQFYPGVGNGRGQWADRADVWAPRIGWDPPEVPCFGIEWGKIAKRARRVAYFHGSVNTWAHRVQYREHYQKLGWALASSTVDYAVELGTAYLPPALEVPGEPSLLRTEDDPLIVAHTPTNPAIASTEDFLRAARGAGVVVRMAHRRPHAEVMGLKKTCNAGFDHLRGSFSVNTLENCAMGLVPLVGLRPEYAERLRHERIPRPPGPAVETLEDLQRALQTLSEDVAVTREYQEAARAWFLRHFTPMMAAPRLRAFYEGL